MPRRKSQYSGPTYYTTYQVAKVLGVSLPTVVNWVNSGILIAHRTPGGHRRIARNDLISFARERDYPLGREFIDAERTSYKVLVVDDEPDFAQMVRDFLSMKGGFEVEIAESGFVAGYTVARFNPDLILMDIMMPDMDGFQVEQMLRADPETRHIPIIACTAFRDESVEERVREHRFDGFVEKPLKLETLLSLIRKELGLGIE